MEYIRLRVWKVLYHHFWKMQLTELTNLTK